MVKNKISAVLCVLAIVLWCMAGVFMTASAEETTGSMTLWCVKDDDIVVNMHWQLYRVGHREGNNYVFEGDFAGCRMTLGDQTKPMLEWDTETVASAAESLKLKTIADKTEKRDDGYTNSSGAVTFDGLENGLYLVWGDVLIVGNTTYVPSAIFFEMNGEDPSVVNAYPKIVLRTLSDSNSQYSVRKVWQNDEDQPWERAVSITVERYRDNSYYDEIELSEDNDWTYEWEDTEEHIWFVYEKVIPDGYTVSYKENYTQYLIINTYEGETSSTTETQTTTTITETTAVDTQTTASLDSTDKAVTSKSSTVKTTTTPPPSTAALTTEKAPQTGQLWWPVPALVVGGLLCFGIGFTIRKKNDEEED
ncbi:MAG: Cna B-type domain-containing protein [Ruminococcus sp.]|nr:Cna B-type domain-containing protein [Ruminococcus sp.]